MEQENVDLVPSTKRSMNLAAKKIVVRRASDLYLILLKQNLF